jgi:hypothetical protein
MAAAIELRDSRGLCCLGQAMIGVEQHLPSQEDAGHPQQPVGDAAQGATVGLATLPQGLVAAAALGIVPNGDAGPSGTRPGVAGPGRRSA